MTLAAQRVRAQKHKEEQEAKAQAFAEKMRKITSFFAGAEYPDPKKEQPDFAAKYQEGYEKMEVSGEKIEDPSHPENIYGGGHWWIIQENWIWSIQNNGGDGDNWAWNNVNTGGAGAIGHRVPYNEELAELIRSLKQGESK